jgi:hypothetical protein
VVNAHQRDGWLAEAFDEPVGNSFARPVFAGAGRRCDFARIVRIVRRIDTQALEAGLAGFCPGMVDPDVSFESRAHFPTAIDCNWASVTAAVIARHSRGVG